MGFTIDKLTYADGLAYRYHIRDEEGELLFIADRSGMLLPSPTRLVEFFDPGRNLAAKLQPPDVLPWQRATRYEVLVGDEAEPYALIHEKWRLVDLLLLRMPRYTVEVGEHKYSARATRYGKRLCELLPAPEEEDEEADAEEDRDEPEGDSEQAVEEAAEQVEVLPLEELVATDEEDEEQVETPDRLTLATIERPPTGAGYCVAVEEEAEAAPLREDLFALASLAILIDMELFS